MTSFRLLLKPTCLLLNAWKPHRLFCTKASLTRTNCLLKGNHKHTLFRTALPVVHRQFVEGPVRLFTCGAELSAPAVSRSIQTNVQGLIARRPAKKKATTSKAQDKDAVYKVVAYATAEEYDLEGLSGAIHQQGLYLVSSLPKDAENVLYVCAKYKVDETLREIFFFREGCAVFWNMPETERSEVLRFVEKYSDSVYGPGLIQQELEEMDFVLTQKSPSLTAGTIHIQDREVEKGADQAEEQTDDLPSHMTLHKYAFSNALSLSVKLGIWEASLDKFVESIEPVLEDMTTGKKIRMSKQEVLQKTGELFTLRHLINLSSDLLDLPDFYWDREKLEKLYQQTFSYLNIPKRTKVMNEKLNHCFDLTELLSSHLNDVHHVRLEWMIILLIMVEVFFEIVHYIEKYTIQEEYHVAAETEGDRER